MRSTEEQNSIKKVRIEVGGIIVSLREINVSDLDMWKALDVFSDLGEDMETFSKRMKLLRELGGATGFITHKQEKEIKQEFVSVRAEVWSEYNKYRDMKVRVESTDEEEVLEPARKIPVELPLPAVAKLAKTEVESKNIVETVQEFLQRTAGSLGVTVGRVRLITK